MILKGRREVGRKSAGGGLLEETGVGWTQSEYILDMCEVFNKQKYCFIKATWKCCLILGNNNDEKNNKTYAS